MPLWQEEGFSFALAFSRSMTTSWLRERQGKERGVGGSGTGENRPVGRRVWGQQVAASRPPSCHCCQIVTLLCGRCNDRCSGLPPQRQRPAKAVAGPGLHCSPDTDYEVRRQVWKANETFRAPATSPKLCYRPRRNQPISRRWKASGWRGDTVWNPVIPPTLPPAILWEADRCSPAVWRGGALISCVDQFYSPHPLAGNPARELPTKTPGGKFPPLVVSVLVQESTGRFSQRRRKLFTLRCSDNMVWWWYRVWW